MSDSKIMQTIKELKSQADYKRISMIDPIMTKTLKELALEIDKANKEINVVKDHIFKNFMGCILERLKKVCESIIIGRKVPVTCCEEFSIPFSIAKSSISDIRKGVCGDYEIDFEGDQIVVFVEATFNGETDSTYRFKFPAADREFEAYIEKLEKEGAELERLKAIERDKQLAIQIQKEKEELIRLQNKYKNHI